MKMYALVSRISEYDGEYRTIIGVSPDKEMLERLVEKTISEHELHRDNHAHFLDVTYPKWLSENPPPEPPRERPVPPNTPLDEICTMRIENEVAYTKAWEAYIPKLDDWEYKREEFRNANQPERLQKERWPDGYNEDKDWFVEEIQTLTIDSVIT